MTECNSPLRYSAFCVVKSLEQGREAMNNQSSDLGVVTTGLKSLSNAKFLKWFLLLNGALAVGLIWTGPWALLVPFLGFAGAMLSLVFAKWLAKRAHNIKIIDPNNPASSEEEQLHAIVVDLVARAGLEHVPEVGIYDSPDMNAFATGTKPSNALVAFSSGLLGNMERDQIQAVAAHEIAHIANRDMLGIVLLQGVINSIVLFVTLPLNVLRLFNFFSKERSWLLETGLWLVKATIGILLTFLGSLVVKAFSRSREYRADAYAAVLLGKEPMMSALKALSADTAEIPVEQSAYAAFKVSGRMSLSEIFSTHPPIEKRLAALNEGSYAPRLN